MTSPAGEGRWRRISGLFVSYFRIAAFTVGGGMVMLALMEDEFVRKRRWLTAAEFIDVVALVNALPGLIAVNSSLIIGRKVAGIPGAAAACLGGILPSILIIIVLAPVITVLRRAPAAAAAFTAVRAAVAALILLLIVRQAKKTEAGVREAAFGFAALLAIRIGGLHPILVIPMAAAAGVMVYGTEERSAERRDGGSAADQAAPAKEPVPDRGEAGRPAGEEASMEDSVGGRSADEAVSEENSSPRRAVGDRTRSEGGESDAENPGGKDSP